MKIDEVKIAHEILLDLLIDFHNFCEKNNLKYYLIGGTLLGAKRHGGFIPWDVDADVAMPREDYNKFLSLSRQFSNDYYLQNILSEHSFHTPKTKILVLGAKKDNPNNTLVSAKTGLNLDIFPLDNPPENKELRAKQRKQLKICKLILALKLKMKYNPTSLKGHLYKNIRNLIRILLMLVPNKFIVNFMTKEMTKYNNVESKYLCSMASHYDYNKQYMEKEIYGQGTPIEFCGETFIGPDRVEDYLIKIYGEYMNVPTELEQESMYKNLILTLDEKMKQKYLHKEISR